MSPRVDSWVMPTLRGMPSVLGSGLSMIAAGVAALMLVSVVLAFHGWPGVASSGPIPRVVAVAATGPASHARVPTLVIAPTAAPAVQSTNVAAPSQRPSGGQVHPYTGTSRRPGFVPATGSVPTSSNSAPAGSGGGTAPQPRPQPKPQPTDPVTSVLNQVTGTPPPSGPSPTLPQTVNNASQAVQQVVSAAAPPPVSSPVNKVVDGVTGTAGKLLGGK